jgi:deoxyhypusine synthase
LRRRIVSSYCDLKADKTFSMNKGPVSNFIQHHYRHFNAAALMDAAKGYEQHLLDGGKMMVTLAGAMSTAE